jgi:arylsulfatase A-like enzyme
VNDSIAKLWRRGYYSAVSFVDSNIGKAVDALDELGFTKNTVVVLNADHGE